MGPFTEGRALKGTRGQGKRYERAVAAELERKGWGHTEYGLWFEFEDQCGPGWAQPDILVDLDNSPALLVIECKRTFQSQAELKLRELYGPLVQAIWPHRSLVLVEVCKYMALGSTPTCELEDLANLAPDAKTWPFHICHWIGT